MASNQNLINFRSGAYIDRPTAMYTHSRTQHLCVKYSSDAANENFVYEIDFILFPYGQAKLKRHFQY